VGSRLEYGEWYTERTRRRDCTIVGNVEFQTAPRPVEDAPRAGGRRKALFQQVDGRRRVRLGLLIFPLNPCGAAKGSIVQLAAALATRSSGQRKWLPSLPGTRVLGLSMRFMGTSGAPRCHRKMLGWGAFGARSPVAWRLALVGERAWASVPVTRSEVVHLHQGASGLAKAATHVTATDW
jgi:hypothetical protein